MALHLPLQFVETPPALFRRPPRRPLIPSLSRSRHLPSLAAERPLTQVLRRRRTLRPSASAGKEETEIIVSDAEQQEPTPEDLEYVRQIKRVLELLEKNRNMIFGEVRLTVMIEDPRDTERKILLGIEDPDELTRDDLVAALEDVHEGRIPENRVALRLLAEEMNQWPDLEVEVPKANRRKSLYAKATDTGVDPREAAKRLNIDWDSAVDSEPVEEDSDDIEVPPALGYGALYLVTALPVIIGISVVLILFFNSLQ